MDKDLVYRKARRAAVKFAKAKWGQQVEAVTLNMVTSWVDPNGLSRWEISLATEGVPTSEWVEISLKTFEPELLPA